MKLKREVVVAAVVALVLTVVLIGAVAAKVVSSLANEQGVITDLHMSNSCIGDDMILFPADTDRVYVVFDYSDMVGRPYRIAVTDADLELELYNETHSYTESGTECITVTYLYPPIPPDTYRTQIWDGDYPIKTKLWHVRRGGPGEITNLHMSISPDPDAPSRKEFIEGTRTVWAVFDYAYMEENEVGVDVYKGDSRIEVISARVTLNMSGTKAISVTHQYITGFPIGQYRTHILKLVDGDELVDGIVNWSVLYGVYLPLVCKNQP